MAEAGAKWIGRVLVDVEKARGDLVNFNMSLSRGIGYMRLMGLDPDVLKMISQVRQAIAYLRMLQAILTGTMTATGAVGLVKRGLAVLADVS